MITHHRGHDNASRAVLVFGQTLMSSHKLARSTQTLGSMWR